MFSDNSYLGDVNDDEYEGDQHEGLYIDRTEENRYNGNLTRMEYQAMVELFDHGYRRYQTNLHLVKNGLSIEECLQELHSGYQYRLF
jgi:hypothetical protein